MGSDPAERKPASPMWFAHLELGNWRNFPRVDVALARRAFVVGPNASGKSNLLDVFKFLRDIASVGGGLQEAIRRRGGIRTLRFLGSSDAADILVRVRVRADKSRATWEYLLQFNGDGRQGPLLTRERVMHGDLTIVERPDDADKKDRERLAQTYLEQLSANREFRELAEFFASIRYLHVVPQFVKEPGRVLGRPGDPYGTDIVQQIAQTPNHARLPRLNRINEALRLAVPQFKRLDLWSDDQGVPHLRGFSEHWPPSAYQTEDQFSDGTLRFIGMLWALLETGGPLLLEEPELSLHPGVVRQIPQMMGRINRLRRCQVLLSTHSRDLLEDPGIGLDETVLLVPGRAGTIVKRASNEKQVKALLEGGATLADAVMPLTSPDHANRLPLFSDALEGATLSEMASLAHKRGDLGASEDLYRRSLSIYEKLGDEGGQAECLHHLGGRALELKEFGKAKEMLTRSLAIDEKLGNREGAAVTLQWLSLLDIQAGDFTAARGGYLRSLRLFEELGDKSATAKTLHNLAALAVQMNAPGEAEKLYQKSIRVHEEIGDRLGIAAALHELGTLARHRGDLKEAGRLYQESTRIRESS